MYRRSSGGRGRGRGRGRGGDAGGVIRQALGHAVVVELHAVARSGGVIDAGAHLARVGALEVLVERGGVANEGVAANDGARGGVAGAHDGRVGREDRGSGAHEGGDGEGAHGRRVEVGNVGTASITGTRTQLKESALLHLIHWSCEEGFSGGVELAKGTRGG